MAQNINRNLQPGDWSSLAIYVASRSRGPPVSNMFMTIPSSEVYGDLERPNGQTLPPLCDFLPDDHHHVTLTSFGPESPDQDVAVLVGSNYRAGLVEPIEIVQARNRSVRVNE